jgi:hypothetical protein
LGNRRQKYTFFDMVRQLANFFFDTGFFVKIGGFPIFFIFATDNQID